MLDFEIRGAVPSDEDQVLAVARHLNTVNLPNDREGVRLVFETAHIGREAARHLGIDVGQDVWVLPLD